MLVSLFLQKELRKRSIVLTPRPPPRTTDPGLCDREPGPACFSSNLGDFLKFYLYFY